MSMNMVEAGALNHRRRYQTHVVVVLTVLSVVRALVFVVIAVAVPSVRVICLAVAIVLAVPAWLGARSGIVVRDDGIRINSATGSRLSRWDEIAEFQVTTVRHDACCALLVLTDGREFRSLGFRSDNHPNDQQRMEIQQGVDELNALLEAHRVGLTSVAG